MKNDAPWQGYERKGYEDKVIEGKERLIGEGPIFEFDGRAEIREIMAIPQTYRPIVRRFIIAYIQ